MVQIRTRLRDLSRALLEIGIRCLESRPMLLIHALRKQRQMNLFEFQAGLFYTVISKPDRAIL